jgi:uncharacterized protein with FMN-binding domain
MRRAPIVLSATVAGVVGVLSFHPREPAQTAAVASGSTSSGAAGSSGSGSGSSSASGSSSSGKQTATGDAISTVYGDVQVRVTVEGGKITEIEALQLQDGDPRSAQISSSAEPLLRESALAKQSADVDAVSGATVTSAGYEASLQSALDMLGFEAADGSRGSSEIPEVEEHHGPQGFGPGA